MTVLLTLLVIAVLILVHEWGHFRVARRIGIPVYEFSLGFGYKLYSTKYNGVEYSLRLIPLGGYVRMAGEEPGDMEDPNGFSARTPLEKIRVAFAGPFMNFVAAIFIFIYSFAVIGVAQPIDEAVIGEVLPGKPAELAGLQSGDRIMAVDSTNVGTWEEFVTMIRQQTSGEEITITINRDGIEKDLALKPIVNETSGIPMIGVYSKVEFEKQNILNSIKYGFIQTYQMTMLLLSGLGMMFSGAVSSSDLAGPVGIASMVGEAARGGLVYLLNFTAFLSINLGILNLLPIPALDGSRIVFAIVELVRRRPLNPEKEGMIHWFGFLFLMALIVFATYNDILRLIRG
ncbi:MAG: RIP metalloprotease RseP [Bacillota bacterium]|nr:RIP metalloprotease RseP [Bacillota bacterium]